MAPVSLTMPSRMFFALIAAAFCLRVVFVFLTPAWQSPDEYPHYWTASAIARGEGYPAGSPDFPRYEAYQSPLYYCLLAGVISISGLPALEYPETVQGPSLPLVLLRLVSVLCGVAVVAAAWGVASVMFPGDRPAALVAGAFVAVLPTFVGISSSLNNDILVILFSSLFLGLVLRPFAGWTRGSCLGGGFLLGAAIATKLTGLLLLPVLVVRLAAGRRELRGGLLRSSLLFLPGCVIGVGVLAIRNLLVYGHLLVITPGLERGFAVSDGRLLWALRNMGWSFWLAFGRTYEVHLSPQVYILVAGVLTAVALAGWWRYRGTRAARSNALLIAIATALGVAASLTFTLSYPSGTQTSWGKNLYPLLPLFAAFAGFGWTKAFPEWSRAVSGIAIAVLLAGSAWGLTQIAW